MIPWGDAMLVSCHDLRFGWDEGDAIVLDSFSVARGERIFVRGPSGSGKSSLLGLLAGVLVPRSGHVRIEETIVSSLSASARDRFRADHIGYVFQQFNLLPYLSVLDNVLLGCAFSLRRQRRAGGSLVVRQEAARLLAALGIGDARMYERRVTELSVGQQQRVAAARALIGGPTLLLADEPTSALDTDARDAFLRLLLLECDRAGAGLVFVSHDIGLARYFDRVVELSGPSQRAAPCAS
ncbi:MAG TPA: ATP-binding cassette domain-containing protein [Dyella sp.]|uniref:ATP-binding cassette domain-containing protein n=1 Tax=Dyella sp. TaxID=1869338 RepID=UPI002F9462A5